MDSIAADKREDERFGVSGHWGGSVERLIECVKKLYIEALLTRISDYHNRMKTSSISQRVVDFLHEYPPFEYIKEGDLLELANKGRVKFHEKDEIIFSAGEPRERWFYVIQQGTVEIMSKEGDSEHLVDVRVEGDLLGVFWIIRADNYTHTARTTSDTILYALDWADFSALAQKYPKASRYLAAYFTLHPSHELEDTQFEENEKELFPAEEETWVSQSGNTLGQRAKAQLVTCAPHASLREVALLLEKGGKKQCCLVTDDAGLPLGIISRDEVVHALAHHEAPLVADAATIMDTSWETIRPGLEVGEIVIALMRSRHAFLCLTQDGTRKTPVLGCITEQDFQVLHGRLPNRLLVELVASEDRQEIIEMRERADELLQYYLEASLPIDWVSHFLSEMDDVLVERAIAFAEAELLEADYEKPELDFCWLGMHAEGRMERFFRTEQRTGLVYEDADEATENVAHRWFVALADKVTQFLEACGFPCCPRGLMANQEGWCLSLRKWKALFSEWVSEPEKNEIILLTPFFDLRGVAGALGLADQLQDHVHRELEANTSFMPLLAEGAIHNLPPVTIFRDSVLDNSGVLWAAVDTQQHALLPLVDTARVFALRYGIFNSASTVERFEKMAFILPRNHRLFEDAAEATRVMLALQTLTGFRRRDNGQFIRADELTKIDQEKLKSVFRTIVQLLEFSKKHFELT